MPRKRKHWEGLKNTVWQRCGGRCERCGERLRRGACHLHHLTYERRGQELPEDVEYICLDCHKEEHPNHTFRPVWEQREVARLRRKKRERAERRLGMTLPEHHARNAMRKVKHRIENGGKRRRQRSLAEIVARQKGGDDG